MKKKNDAVTEQNKKEYILPSGLRMKSSSFISHYKVSRGTPVMIVGDTGVGKSLFLHIYESLWKEEKSGPVVWANCAHFGGPTSDPNIARAELFGYDPTLLGKSGRPGYPAKLKPGLIDKANDGLLILEEIGELPFEVQAMLLTFVETGYYRAVGSDSDKRASVRIVGSTNRESALRDDFRYRFFPFYVPPVYQRRKDVLYYIAATDEDLLRTLTPWEVLVLLGYNWPGNVREIERVCRLLERRRKLFYYYPGLKNPEIFAPHLDPLNRILLIEKMDTALDAMQAMNLREDMKAQGVAVGLLEDILRKFNVGLDDTLPSSHPFQDYNLTHDALNDLNKSHTQTSSPKQKIAIFFELLEKIELDRVSDTEDRFPFLKNMRDYKSLDKAHLGYLLFCFIFFQDPEGNSSVFDMGTSPTFYADDLLYASLHAFLEPNSLKALHTLRVQIFEYRSGIKLPIGTVIPMDYDQSKAFFNSLADAHPDNDFLARISGRAIKREKPTKNDTDIYSIPFDEFMKNYHQKLIERYGGNVAEAARKTQVKYQTLQSRLREYKFK